MKIRLNLDICERVDCEFGKEKYGRSDRCIKLNDECKMREYHHWGCKVPDKCEYKNLHVISGEKFDSKMKSRMCDNCIYQPKE